MEIAPKWRRVGARAVDTAILLLVVWIALRVGGAPGFLILGAIYGLVHPVMSTVQWGKTAGKALFGIRVVLPSGENPDFGVSLSRWFLQALCTGFGLMIGLVILALDRFEGDGLSASEKLWPVVLTLAFPVTNLFVVLSNRNGQGLHDHIGPTWVVRD